jgi:hypothetical protein
VEIGDYDLLQVSMWDFAPEGSLEVFKEIRNTLTDQPMLIHYYAVQVTEIISDNHWRVRTVMKDELHPEALHDFLQKRGVSSPHPSLTQTETDK